MIPKALRLRSGTEETTTGDERSSEGGLRKALLGLGLLGAAAVVVNRKRGLPTSVDELRETLPDAAAETTETTETTEAETVSIDGESADEGQTSEESETEGGSAVRTDSDSADEERSDGTEVSEAMEERSVEDVPEEPAEPGEMNVDDDVVDEVVEGDENGGSDEESADEDRADQG